MQRHAAITHPKTRVRSLLSAARDLLRSRTWNALARLTALCALLALPVAADADSPPAEAGAAAAETSQATTPPAAPERRTPALGEPTQIFNPTAGSEWVDRLSKARRRVLDANKASDAANEEYARALFHKMPEGPALDAVKTRREHARGEYVEAMKAVPDLVARARAAGVSPDVLRIYEESMPR
jgi:hypothetical protein